MTLNGHRLLSNLAEAAFPRTLFADILRLIAELQPPPDPVPV
jgi:hypothetical protein